MALGGTRGILWKLVEACVVYGGWEWRFKRLLDFFQDRGEDLNDICEPEGSVLHVLVLAAIDTPQSLSKYVQMLADRGADVDISGPLGTPLQMVWKSLRSCDLTRETQYNLAAILRSLKYLGANCDWVEPDGTVVNERELDVLDPISMGEWDHQRQMKTYSTDSSTWIVPYLPTDLE